MKRLLCLMWLLLPTLVWAGESRTIEAGDAAFETEVFPASGRMRVLWFPPETGFGKPQRRIARALAQRGIEVWLVDVFASYFLPSVASSLARIPGEDVAVLLGAAGRDGRRLILLGTGRGILPLLRGAHAYQLRHPDNRSLAGAILLSPQFFVSTPDPGEAAEILPVVRRTNLPLFILQPKNSPWYWKLPRILPVLEAAGSEVYVQILPGLRDRFHFRPDATPTEQQAAERLPLWIARAARLLARLPPRPRPVLPLDAEPPKLPEGKKERRLRPYAGDPTPPALNLPDLQGRIHRLADYRGQVVLINFWASWCPPCVHEMPSMQRLADAFAGRPFTILAVNMAEDEATIRRFLREKVRVRFPILLDRDGAALKRWQVFAFPTSYLLDRQGRIRYALFGAIDWDAPPVKEVVEGLLDEAD